MYLITDGDHENLVFSPASTAEAALRVVNPNWDEVHIYELTNESVWWRTFERDNNGEN